MLMVIADSGEAVLSPVIGARPGLIVREVVPGIAVRTVIFAYGSPLPLAEIRTPQPPRYAVVFCFGEPRVLGCTGLFISLAARHPADSPLVRIDPRTNLILLPRTLSRNCDVD